MTWQILLMVVMVAQWTAANILVRSLEELKKPRNVRILNQAGTVSKTAEGGFCLLLL